MLQPRAPGRRLLFESDNDQLTKALLFIDLFFSMHADEEPTAFSLKCENYAKSSCGYACSSSISDGRVMNLGFSASSVWLLPHRPSV